MRHASLAVTEPPLSARRPPGPNGLPGLGSMISFHRDPNGFLLRLALRFGDVSRFSVVNKQFFLFNHPELIRELLVSRGRHLRKGRLIERARRFLGDGLITSEEPRHLAQRRLIQPHFDGAHLRQYGAVVSAQLDRWMCTLSESRPLDLDVEMRAFTLSVVAKALFDADIDEDTERIGGALRDLERGYPLLMLPRWVERLPVRSIRRVHRARRYLDESIYRLIRERRGCHGDDLISRFAVGGGCRMQQPMSEDLIRDEIMTLFVAGHETTANALTWALHLIASHPVVERRLLQELRSVLGGRSPTVDDVPALRYTEMVLAETLRLYPPVGRIGRRASTDITVRSYTIPAGSVMFVSPYATQRDPRFFPKPEAFEPDRWLPAGRAAQPRFSYFPYGAGSRMCIGASFANMTGILTIAAIMQRWRVVPKPDHAVVPRRLMTMAPRHGAPVTLFSR